MTRFLLTVLLTVALAATPVFSQAPPVGTGGQVQPTKTGNYTVKSTDLKTTLPFNCATGCVVTMPLVTATWPKGAPVKIINVGPSGTVTIHATPTSTFSGMVPAFSADIPLTGSGNWAEITATTGNNYLALGGGSGTGGGGGVALMIDATNCLLVSPGICYLVQ